MYTKRPTCQEHIRTQHSSKPPPASPRQIPMQPAPHLMAHPIPYGGHHTEQSAVLPLHADHAVGRSHGAHIDHLVSPSPSPPPPQGQHRDAHLGPHAVHSDAHPDIDLLNLSSPSPSPPPQEFQELHHIAHLSAPRVSNAVHHAPPLHVKLNPHITSSGSLKPAVFSGDPAKQMPTVKAVGSGPDKYYVCPEFAWWAKFHPIQ